LIQTAGRFTQDGRFVAIFGQEFSSISSGNHGNVFEVTSVIDEAQVPNGAWDLLLNTWIPANPDTTGQQALVLLNHPATSGSPNDREYGLDDFASFDGWRTALDARAELINIINGPSHDDGPPGRPAESEYRRYLNLGLHVGPTADQDNHRPNWGSAAETRTGVIAAALTKPAIMAALRARHVYASEDRNLRIIARIGGHLIGTRVTGTTVPPVGAEIQITIDVRDPDEPGPTYLVEVFSDQIGGNDDANIVRTGTRDGDGSLTITGLRYEGGDQYVFLRITQQHDDVTQGDRVWTAPVWFEPNGVSPAPMPQPPAPALVLLVDLVAETARVENGGAVQVDLSGWQLVSTQGNQRFTFPAGTLLGPGQAVTVVSGAAAANPTRGQLAWTTQNIWRNAGDPGELRNPQDEVVARHP